MTGRLGQTVRGSDPLSAARRPVRRRGGTILIVTMWVLLVLAGMALVLARGMRVEGTCSANHAAELQADAVEQGAVQYVLSRVEAARGRMPSDTDMPCEGVPVGDGAFWIIRPNFDDDRSPACGLTDEACKLHLNTATVNMLQMLPGMTQELAASLYDWRSAGEIPSIGGAKSEYYLISDDPYYCKGAPLDSVDEVLLVKGFTRDVLSGEDVNRNGVLDESEDLDGDGRLFRGLAAFVTVWSAEPNAPAGAGSQVVNVRNNVSSALRDLLTKQIPDSARRTTVINTINANRPPRGGYRSLLEFYLGSRMTEPEFQPIEARLTVGAARGQINIKGAPAEVLACLPGLNEGDVTTLLGHRAMAADANSVTWIEKALGRPKANSISRYVTTRSYRFSADIVSVSAGGRAFRRCRLVVDAGASPPKVLYRQNLTHLGWPLPEEVLLALRAGKTLDEAVAAGYTTNVVLGPR